PTFSCSRLQSKLSLKVFPIYVDPYWPMIHSLPLPCALFWDTGALGLAGGSCLSVSVVAPLATHPSVHPSTCLSVDLCIYPCDAIHVAIHASIPALIPACMHLYIYPSVHSFK